MSPADGVDRIDEGAVSKRAPRVWVIEVGEPLPIDPQKGRRWRAGHLSAALLDRGADVTWWAGAFDHGHKTFRANRTETRMLSESHRIVLLHGPGYSRNVSVRRVLHNRAVAKEFLRRAEVEPRPDVVVCCVPTLELGDAATRFGTAHGIPVALDYRDLHPEIFVQVFPSWARPVGRFALSPLFRMAARQFGAATAVMGITDAFVDKALALTDRTRGPLDLGVPHGYQGVEPPADELRTADAFWTDRGLAADNCDFVVGFVGSLSKRLELETLIRAVRQLEDDGLKLRCVIAGEGEDGARCRALSEGSKALTFPGWIGLPEIWTLLRRCSVGVVPYPSTEDFKASYPNKAIEYLSAGLPVLTGIQGGVLQMLLDDTGAGKTYVCDDPQALASLLRRLHGDAAALRAMSKAAEKIFRERFMAEQVYGGFADHVLGLIDGAVPSKGGVA